VTLVCGNFIFNLHKIKKIFFGLMAFGKNPMIFIHEKNCGQVAEDKIN
jgi:hypothetical protein